MEVIPLSILISFHLPPMDFFCLFHHLELVVGWQRVQQGRWRQRSALFLWVSTSNFTQTASDFCRNKAGTLPSVGTWQEQLLHTEAEYPWSKAKLSWSEVYCSSASPHRLRDITLSTLCISGHTCSHVRLEIFREHPARGAVMTPVCLHLKHYGQGLEE